MCQIFSWIQTLHGISANFRQHVGLIAHPPLNPLTCMWARVWHPGQKGLASVVKSAMNWCNGAVKIWHKHTGNGLIKCGGNDLVNTFFTFLKHIEESKVWILPHLHVRICHRRKLLENTSNNQKAELCNNYMYGSVTATRFLLGVISSALMRTRGVSRGAVNWAEYQGE